jgi:hypothetical protein
MTSRTAASPIDSRCPACGAAFDHVTVAAAVRDLLARAVVASAKQPAKKQKR